MKIWIFLIVKKVVKCLAIPLKIKTENQPKIKGEMHYLISSTILTSVFAPLFMIATKEFTL